MIEPLGLCVLFGGEREAERDLWNVRLWLYHLPLLVDESLSATRTCSESLSALIDFEGHELGPIKHKQPTDTTHMLCYESADKSNATFFA